MKRCHFFYFLPLIFLCACHPSSSADQRRADKHQRDSIALADQQRSLEYYQSQLEALAPEADSLLALFTYTKEERYQDHGYYMQRGQQTSRNTARNYLQALVSDEGKPIVKCFYYGASRFDFRYAELSCEALQNSFQGTPYSFEAEGWHQILTLEDSVATELLRFVDAHAADRIRIRYTDGQKAAAVFVLHEADRTALLRAYQLSIVISDMRELEKRIQRTSLEIEKYQKRLEKR